MIIINGVIHPMDGPVIPRGYVSFADGKITGVGPMEERPAGEDEVLDAAGGIRWTAASGRHGRGA